LLAEEKYRQVDYNNKKIHDTHGSERDLLFPDHYHPDLKHLEKVPGSIGLVKVTDPKFTFGMWYYKYGSVSKDRIINSITDPETQQLARQLNGTKSELIKLLLVINIQTKMSHLLKRIVETGRNRFILYPESQSAYQLYGCDFMIDYRGEVYILEINYKPSFGKKYIREVSDRILTPLINEIIKPHFGHPAPRQLELTRLL